MGVALPVQNIPILQSCSMEGSVVNKVPADNDFLHGLDEGKIRFRPFITTIRGGR